MKMKKVILMCCKYRMVLPVAFALATLSSCEKVIDLDLNGAEKKYVIEAQVTDEPGKATVLISQTKDFDEDNNFSGITGATVTVTEEVGPSVTFSETSPGVYRHAALAAAAGKNYHLSVLVNGETFTASCRMPERVNLDTVYTTDEFIFTATRKVTNADYQDPLGRGNYYRFVQYINNIRVRQIIVQSDEYTDGRYVNNKLFYFAEEDSNEPEEIKSGDTVKVEMLCIDPAIYKYWYSLSRSATGVSGQATPANPVTNMKGGALGYFSVHTMQAKTAVVP